MSWVAMAGHQMDWGVVDDGWRKGPWTAEEDKLLIEYVQVYGEGRWNSVARLTGLKRNGKSCRLRWVNYLRPDLKKGQITPQEERVIIDLHAKWGNRWSTIARSLPGRTDNEIKNYWRTHFKKRTKTSVDVSQKAKNRHLKRQQFQQQQQQFQQQQQQQQQLQIFNQLDIKRIMSLFDEGSNNSSLLTQEKQEMLTTTLHTTDENDFINSNYYHGNTNFVHHPNEEILWDGAWNLDEFQSNLYYTCASNKAAFPSDLVVPFC